MAKSAKSLNIRKSTKSSKLLKNQQKHENQKTRNLALFIKKSRFLAFSRSGKFTPFF